MSEVDLAPAADSEPGQDQVSPGADSTVKGRIDALIESGVKPDKPDEGKKPAEKKPDDKPDEGESHENESLSESDIDAELASLDTDESEDDSPETDDNEAAAETLDAKKLAEKLDIPIDEVYSMKFPYGEGGEAITLGELKDAGIRARTIDAEAETLADDRNSFVNEQMKSRAELQSIVALLPDGIPPELVNQANYQRQVAVDRERTSLLEAIPDWQDAGIEKIARDAITENLKQYGFQPIEITNMLDHRLVKLMHDFTRMRQKIVKPMAELKARKKSRRSNRPGSRETRGKAQVAKAKLQGKTDVKGAIDTLLPRG